MVKAIKKSSSSAAAAEVVVAGVPPLRSAEKSGSKLRSLEKKKKRIEKKRIEKKDMEMVDDSGFEHDTETVDDSGALHIYEHPPVVKKILPEDSKTLFTANIACPDGRKIMLADFVKFFQKVGKVVDVSIKFHKNEQFVELAEIEFESHDVAKKALKKFDGRMLFGTFMNLEVSRERRGEKHVMTDCTYQRQIIYIAFGKAFEAYRIHTKLEKYFKPCGEILWIRARVDEHTGLSVGFAHIAFKDGKSLSNALELDGTQFMGAPWKVRRAKVFVTTV